jgi:hypothetical protein
MIRVVYAIAFSLVAAMLVTLASVPPPKPRPVEVPPQPAERELTFEERWEPVRQMPRMINEGPLDLSLRIRPVKTITIRPEPAVMVVEEDSGEGADKAVGGAGPTRVERAKNEIVGRTVPSPVSLRRRVRDICARHGMHKQVTRGGKSWRCRR